MDKEDLIRTGVHFVEVDRTFETENKELEIEFTAWLKQQGTKIEGYCYRLPFDEAIEFLDYVIRMGVPTNYKLFELRDTSILVGMQMQETIRSKGVLEDYDRVSRIEFQLPENNLHDILLELVNKDAKILNEVTNKFYPIKNLVFNRDNLNISCRTFDKETGFSTKPIFELVRRNICVRTREKLEEKKYVIRQVACEEGWESILGLETIEMEDYKVTVNGKDVKPVYTLPALSREYMINLFSSVFDLQTAKAVLDALAFNVFDYGKTSGTDYSRKSEYKGPPEKVVRVAPLYTVPTITSLSKMLKGIKQEDIDVWINDMSLTYGAVVANVAKKTLSTLDFSLPSNLPLQIKLQSNNVDRQFAVRGIQSHALKNTMSNNQLFMGLYVGKSYEVQEGMIFNSRVKIESYPDDYL